MRRLLALVVLAAVFLHSPLVGAAPAPQAVNLLPSDLPASAVMYGVADEAASGTIGKDGLVAEYEEDFCFCIRHGHGPYLTRGNETVSSRVELYSTVTTAHAHYLLVARGWQKRSRPDTTPLSIRHIGDEGLSGQGTLPGSHPPKYGYVLFRRGPYVVTVTLDTPTPGYPIQQVFSLAKRVDGYIRGKPHGTAPSEDQSNSAPPGGVASPAFPGVTVSARHLHPDTDRRYPPKRGNQYLVADITIVNHGTAPYYYSALQFFLREGTSTKEYAGDGNDSNIDITWLSYVALKPGQRISGSLAFEVPKSKTTFMLYWLPDIFSAQAIQVPLGK